MSTLLRASGPVVSFFALAAFPAAQQVPYSTTESWESYTSGVTTGGAFVDIDQDGALDFVVANGNDIARQKVEVYFNDGSGNYPNTPQWSSTDIDYHGHLSVGDVNQDGWPDVAVSVFLGPSGFGDKGGVKVYMNQSGTLEGTPSWSSADEFFSFSCDFGDADGDGDLDLAVATGEPYFDPPDKNRIYYNSGGTLATAPGWLSSADDHTLDVAFGDADGDGDLDLAFATSLGPTHVHYQSVSGISTTPGWTATDNLSPFDNTIAWCDVDDDGFLELAVSDNSQLSNGEGVFKIYQNNAGTLATTPFWSDFVGFVSAVAFADLDLDGQPDLAGGVWFGGAQVYLHNGSPYPSAPQWGSVSNSTVEVLVFGDVDGDGVQSVTNEVHLTHGGRTYYVDHAPMHDLVSVSVDGVQLTASQFTYDLEDGWIALGQTPAVDVAVDYEYSDSLDLGVTSWDGSIGNLVFRRYDVPRAVFRNDSGGTNPTGYTAAAPTLNKLWTASVDNSGMSNTLAGVVGYATSLEFSLPCCGVLLVNTLDPNGEALGLAIGAGSGVVNFSSSVANDLSLLGLEVATQGFGFGGGGGINLHNAYDLIVGI